MDQERTKWFSLSPEYFSLTMLQDFLPLKDLVVFFQLWNVKLCLFMHCLWASTQAPEIKDHFLLHYWVCFMSAFSGAMTTSLLIMDPDVFRPPMFGNSSDALMWTLAWWFVNHFPFDLGRRVVKFKPCWIVVVAGSAFCRASIIASKVDYAAEHLPKNVVAAIMLGTMASMAGKPITQVVLSILNVDPSHNEMLVPTFLWWSGFMCTCLYYSFGYLLQIMSPVQSWAVVCSILVSHAILANLVGRRLDFTLPFRRVICTLANLREVKPEMVAGNVEAPSSSGAVNGTTESKKRR